MKTYATLFVLLLSQTLLRGQSLTTVADSLRVPSGLEYAHGRLLIVETGYGFNDGAVSMLAADGSVLPVIVGLPSVFDTTTEEIEGPWHLLALPANKIALTDGASGQLMIFDLTGFVPGTSAPLTTASSTVTYDVAAYVLSHGFLDSNPFSVARDGAGNLYVADAAANAIIKVSTTGQMSVFATFPPFVNPLPFGPPMVDAVPTRILARHDGGFYVSQLTGFPFLDGAANIFSVDATGHTTIYASGLTQLTDLALDALTGDLYALQFGHFDLMGMPPGYAANSAKVTRIKADGTRETVAENFGPSAGMAFDGQGHLYVSDIFSGRVLRMEDVATGILEKPGLVEDFILSPNPASGLVRIAFSLKTPSPVLLRLYDAHGRLVLTSHFDFINTGQHYYNWDLSGQPAGTYSLVIQTSSGAVCRQLAVH